MPTGQINQIKAQKFIDVFDWLVTVLESDEWVEVQKIWNLNPPDHWAAFDLFGRTDYPEQILLAQALEKLKLVWRTGRPRGFFGNNFKEPKFDETEQNECEESSDQSSL